MLKDDIYNATYNLMKTLMRFNIAKKSLKVKLFPWSRDAIYDDVIDSVNRVVIIINRKRKQY